jgi:enoyl-CoA hydratase/carnithine racemase
MTYETIKYEVEDQILTITLNRPDKLNAFNATMQRELIDAFDQADRDDTVRAIIITGAGRGFCAGADLSSGADTFDRDAKRGPVKRLANGHVDYSDPNARDGGGQVTLRIFKCLKPVIGAINGAAVGIGVTMQLAMDIRIASEYARFGFVFSQRGIVPEAASSWFLPRLVGISQALEWCYTGRVFPAQEALAGRLVSKVVPHDDLLPTARAGSGDRRQDRAGIGGADPPNDVAHAGRRRSDGSPQDRQSRYLFPRAFRRRQGRRGVVFGKAPGEIHQHGVGRHAGLFSVVGRAGI